MVNKISNLSKLKKMVDYLLIYLLLFFATGYQLSIYSGSQRLLLYVGLVILLILCNLGRIKQIKVSQLNLLILIGLLCNIILTSLVNNEGLNQILITTALFLTAYLYTMFYSINDYIKKFIKVMSFLCIFSIVLYFAANILPELVMRLPIVYNSNGLPAYNALFSTVRIDDYLIRNQGIFWEPGAFQTFINLALIFNLFIFREHYKRNFIIFGITLFTTYSTTGYLVGLMIVLAFVLQSLTKIERKKIKQTLGFVCMILILLIVSLISYNNLPNNAKYQLFGKIAYYIESGNYSSTSVRIDAFIYPINQFLTNPIFGNGTLGMTELATTSGYIMNTNTVINWFAMFGIFMGLIMNYGLYRLCKKFECEKTIRLWLFITILFSLFSEDYIRNPSILVLVFYGYHYIKREHSINLNLSRPINGKLLKY